MTTITKASTANFQFADKVVEPLSGPGGELVEPSPSGSVVVVVVVVVVVLVESWGSSWQPTWKAPGQRPVS